MAHDVFISYSSPDRVVAEAICASLESVRIQCWFAPRNVGVGKVWVEAIVDAIDESRIFLLLLSSSSNSSPQVIREVERAASQNITIVPIKIDDTPMSKGMGFFISRHQWLTVQMPLRKQDLDELTQTIQQLLAEDTRFKARQEAEQAAKEKIRQEEEKVRAEAQRLAKEKEERESAERARQQAEEVRKAKEADEKARKEAERLAREKEEREAAELARQQAEEVRKAKEADERVRKEAERLAKEKEEREAAERARQQAEEARKNKEAEESARKEAERLAKEKEQQRAKETAEHARQQAEEARKVKEAEERARKEVDRLAKERVRFEAKEATELARQQAKKVPKEAEKTTQKITGSVWFWASTLLLVIGFSFMIIAPIVNIEKFPAGEESLRAGLGVMLVLGVIPTALGTCSLCRSLVIRHVSKPVWLRVSDVFFIAGVVLPFIMLTIISYGAEGKTPLWYIVAPLLLGANLSFIVPAMFCLRRGLAQELQPQVVKMTQTRGFWLRLTLLLTSLVIPIVFAVLISQNPDPTDGQTVGLGMMLIICSPLIILSVYYFWRGLVKNRLSKQNYLWLTGAFLSLAVALPFMLIGILLSGTPGTAPMWDLILPPVLLVSLPLFIVGVYYLRQGLVKSTVWLWCGLAVMGVIAGGVIAFISIIGPTNLPPITPDNTSPNSTTTPPTTTAVLLPAELVWKISLSFSQNHTEGMPIRDWADDIKAASNGRWQIEIYYNEQLATKDKTLDGIKNGLFQGGLISSQFGSDNTPLLSVLQNPFMSVSDITQQGEWLMAVAQYPAIVEELSTWNAQILFPVCSPPYNFMGNIPLRTADDFVGRKINCYNRGAQALSTFGALQFNIETHLLHSALQNGTVDSVSRPWSIAFGAERLYEVSKYATIDIDLIVEDMYLAISQDAWKELPDEWKQLCQDVAEKAIARYAKYYAEADLTFIPVFKNAGIEITNFPAAERAKLVAKAASVWERWVNEMVTKGLPGQDVLDFAKTKMDEIKSGKTR